MPDFSPDEIYDFDDRYFDDGPAVWTEDELAEQIEGVFDEHRTEVFKAKIHNWAVEHWVPAEQTTVRVGREARSFQKQQLHGPAVIWSGTAAEIIFRELALKPIFVGLFLGEEWADAAVRFMLRGRWLSKEARDAVKAVLKTLADLDVTTFQFNEHVVWEEIPPLLELRNSIVHQGREVGPDESGKAVDVVAGLYMSIVPKMRELCGVTDIPGYVPPELADA